MEHVLIGGNELFMTAGGKKSYTVEDIERLPEGERAELIDGEMYSMASPTLTHQDMLSWFTMKIGSYIMEHGGKCRVLPAPFAVYVLNDDRNYVEPDISVICDESRLDEKGCHGAPDWIIEIVSPASKYTDYVKKLNLYEKAGVREYWIVDPLQKSVTVYGLEKKEGPVLHSFSGQIRAGIYEDLELDLREYQR